MSTLIDEVFAKAGGRDELRKALGVSNQTLSDWKRWGHVSAKRAVAVEALTGISRQDLCPQFNWGIEPPKPAPTKKPRAEKVAA
jgi:DNA-binding transcriptional regulator YdaS (Cro superfamily)